MIRRSFFKVVCGAVAAMFAPKLAEAVVKVRPFHDAEDLERAAWTTSQMEHEEILAAMKQRREAAWASFWGLTK